VKGGRARKDGEALMKKTKRDHLSGLEKPDLFSLIWYLVTDLSRAASGVVMVICWWSVKCSGIAETFIALIRMQY